MKMWALAIVASLSLGGADALRAQNSTASQAAALTASVASGQATQDRAFASVAGTVADNTDGPTSQAATSAAGIANRAAGVADGMANAANSAAAGTENSDGWVGASAPQTSAQPPAANQTAAVPQSDASGANLSGFPTQNVVIAPPANPFPATTKGPGDYGASSVGEASPGSAQQSGANGSAQSLPTPPLINQARDMDSPLAPNEIRQLHEDFDETRRAKAEELVTPIPRISSISVDLSPGGATPVVHTMRNQASSLVFLDATGAPWPLAARPRLASAGYFDVQWLGGTSDVVVTATSSYESVGMAVFLKGLPTPIMVELNSGEPDSSAKTRVIDTRLDIRVPGRGPNAKASFMGTSRIGMYDDVLQQFLDGIPPNDARRVSIEGSSPTHTEVWTLGDSLYLRTPLEIRSAFEQTMSSADGMHIYKLDPTPLIMVSDGGENVSLTLDIE